jgi:hypothetical protein
MKNTDGKNEGRKREIIRTTTSNFLADYNGDIFLLQKIIYFSRSLDIAMLDCIFWPPNTEIYVILFRHITVQIFCYLQQSV